MKSGGAPSSLRILENESDLTKQSQFQSPLPWPASDDLDPPRALRSLSRIISDGLCHRCGSCIGICPTGVLALDKNDYPKVKDLNACTDCDLCVRVCPGDEFDYVGISREFHGKEPELTNTHGNFIDAWLTHSNDANLRASGTSGGFITALLLNLMKTGKIDGAVVIASDENTLWKGKPIVARTEAELIAATKSKYAISPTNSVFGEIRNMPGKYALVGLPCQMHGFQKAARLDPRIKDRVVLTIGLFCHAAIEHDAFRIIWDSLGSRTKSAKQFVSRIGKHPGAPNLVYDDGSTYPVYFGDKKGFRPSSMEMINILYRLYTPSRCLTCFDGLSEFADISVGDPWMPPPSADIDFRDGWSFVLTRSARGVEALKNLVDSKEVSVEAVTSKEAMRCNHHMATEKRWRAFRMIETHRRQGKSIPSYGDPAQTFPQQFGMQFLKTEANMLSHAFCFLPSLRGGVLRFFLGNGGYWLLWLNNKRRRVKFWVRDRFELVKNSLFGRS